MNLGDETRVSGIPDPPQHRPQEGRDQTVINRPVAGRPQILAPQANDPLLPTPTVHEVKRRRTGPVLVLAALLIVGIGAALAAVYFQFGRDETAATATSSTTTPVTTTSVTTTSVPTTVDPNALQVVLTEDPFVCDGDSRQIGLISQAEPNEEIAFSSPQAENLSPGQAGPDGTLPIRWQCDADQVGEVWNLTAAGVTSGKVAIFVVNGVAPGQANPDGAASAITSTTESSATETTSAPAGGTLSVTIDEDPFTCNGETRQFGTLSGAEPNEEIGFTSPQASGIGSGNADANGERVIRWSCTPAQAGTVWEVTATGATSGRTVTFTFTGS